MHIFQKNILDLLRQSSTLRYSKLQPDNIESSHFKYHLNQLVKDGLVEQAGRGIYKLTAKGKAAVDRLSRGRVNPHLTPKVITYTLLYNRKYYYLHRKDKEPYMGLVNMIGGKMHLGESSEDAAKREVHEKTGLIIGHPILRGIAEIRISGNDHLLSHAVAYAYSAELAEETLIPPNLLEIPIASLAQRDDLAPDLPDIINACQSNAELFAINLAIATA